MAEKAPTVSILDQMFLPSLAAFARDRDGPEGVAALSAVDLNSPGFLEMFLQMATQSGNSTENIAALSAKATEHLGTLNPDDTGHIAALIAGATEHLGSLNPNDTDQVAALIAGATEHIGSLNPNAKEHVAGLIANATEHIGGLNPDAKEQIAVLIATATGTNNATDETILTNNNSAINNNTTYELDTSNTVTFLPSSNFTEFNNETTTELPFYDYTSNNDYTYYYNDYANDQNNTTESDNPFLKDDYNWYDYNEVPEGTVFEEYTDEIREEKRQDALSKFDNIAHPPPIRHITARPRDLTPFFVVGPAIVCFVALFLVFLPCIIFKWRDDIREMQGKQRIYGEKGKKKMKKHLYKEKYQMVDPEWQMVTANKTQNNDHRPSAPLNNDDVVLSSSRRHDTYNKSSSDTSSASNDYEMREETNQQGSRGSIAGSSSSGTKIELPSDASTMVEIENEGRKISDSGKTQFTIQESSLTASGSTQSDVDVHIDAKSENEMGLDTENVNFSTSAAMRHGWNKDRYSNSSGIIASSRKNSSSPEGSPRTLEDPSCGMY